MQVELDGIKERNNFLTVSDFTTVTENTIGNFSTKKNFQWSMGMDSKEEWIKINFAKTVILKNWSISYDVPSGSTEGDNKIVIEVSQDNWNWKEIWEGNLPPNPDDMNLDEEAVFLRFKFLNIKRGFKVTDLAAKVLDEYDSQDHIFFFSGMTIPEKIRENDPLLEDVIRTYLEMLENNENHDKKIINDFYYLRMNTSKDKYYAINLRAINTFPTNGLAPSTQS